MRMNRRSFTLLMTDVIRQQRDSEQPEKRCSPFFPVQLRLPQRRAAKTDAIEACETEWRKRWRRKVANVINER